MTASDPLRTLAQKVSLVVPTRYQMLRRAIVNLASSPERQAAYLDDLLASVSGGGSAASYGNGELALQFEDYFSVVEHMLTAGEISEVEVAAARPLDVMLERWSSQSNAEFWTRQALFEDPRWGEVRECARKALREASGRSTGRQITSIRVRPLPTR